MVTCQKDCFFKLYSSHWCNDLSFTCIVESLATKGYELMEAEKVVAPKKQIKKPFCLMSKQSVCTLN